MKRWRLLGDRDAACSFTILSITQESTEDEKKTFYFSPSNLHDCCLDNHHRLRVLGFVVACLGSCLGTDSFFSFTPRCVVREWNDCE
jgi:hypothetical protein